MFLKRFFLKKQGPPVISCSVNVALGSYLPFGGETFAKKLSVFMQNFSREHRLISKILAFSLWAYK